MATHSDLLLLREEEKTLLELRTKLADQLNRLKVEELALQSHIRSEDDMTCDLGTKQEMSERNDDNPADLDLQIFNQIAGGSENEEEEEEEEEEIDDKEAIQDDLTKFVERLESEAQSK